MEAKVFVLGTQDTEEGITEVGCVLPKNTLTKKAEDDERKAATTRVWLESV